ncbi:MAG: helical backbone metal receptor [Candidatus Delongbacteria bacterium]|jgi:iron complex transport system substrate-binding protein|nr:helical backbone metal receptor [Candidatus Delongbacteria bacterium]
MRIYSVISVVIIILIIFISCTKQKVNTHPDLDQKIISLAPSITETLFLLGVAKHIIGVSEYSSFPEEAKSIQVISTITDMNLELIIKLKPDIAFILPSQTKFQEQLLKIGIKSHVIDQRSIEKIITSIRSIGEELKLGDRAKIVSDSLSMILKNVQAMKPSGKNILVSIGRDHSSDINFIYSAGRKTFIDNIITLLGYENALDSDIPYPKISAETIIRLDPDIIIDLIPLTDKNEIAQAKSSWNSLPSLLAVKNKNIYLFTSDYATIPGPRIFKFIQELSDTLGEK